MQKGYSSLYVLMGTSLPLASLIKISLITTTSVAHLSSLEYQHLEYNTV